MERRIDGGRMGVGRMKACIVCSVTLKSLRMGQAE